MKRIVPIISLIIAIIAAAASITSLVFFASAVAANDGIAAAIMLIIGLPLLLGTTVFAVVGTGLNAAFFKKSKICLAGFILALVSLAAVIVCYILLAVLHGAPPAQ